MKLKTALKDMSAEDLAKYAQVGAMLLNAGFRVGKSMYDLWKKEGMTPERWAEAVNQNSKSIADMIREKGAEPPTPDEPITGGSEKKTTKKQTQS